MSSSPDDMYVEGAYIVHNNMWNAGGHDVQQTTSVCSPRNWFTTVTAGDGSWDPVVKTYPNVHKDYRNWGTGTEPLVSSFTSITSSFAHRAPEGQGIYNVAYDLWLNGVPGQHEVMIWTDNHGQFPAGSLQGQVTLSGQTWQLFATATNSILTFRPSDAGRLTSGTIDLKAFLDHLMSVGRIPADATLGQICYGVEVASTNGHPVTFEFTDFSVSDVR